MIQWKALKQSEDLDLPPFKVKELWDQSCMLKRKVDSSTENWLENVFLMDAGSAKKEEYMPANPSDK